MLVRWPRCCCRAASRPATPAIAPPAAGAAQMPLGSGFDFYVLSLSWSPSYCEAEGEDANPQQCKAARPYAFVVHGLWPQFERGFPEDCPTDEPKVTNETLRTLYDLMPSAGLIRHEWTSHGACTGLSQGDYFTVLRAAREKIAIPQQYQQIDDYLTVAPRDAEAAFLQGQPDDAGRRHRRHLRQALPARGAHLPDQGPQIPLMPGDRPPRLPAGQGGDAAGAREQ